MREKKAQRQGAMTEWSRPGLVDTRIGANLPPKGDQMSTRKRYADEFKIEAVRLMLNRGERTIADVAEALGVGENQLYRWRSRYEGAVHDPSKHARETAERAQIRRLKKENAELKMEREILRKAAAFFAKESR